MPDRNPATLRSRLDVQFFRRPRPFWRHTWRLAALCAVLPLVWFGYCVARGNRSAFQAGQLSPPHRFFENDCARCHDTWGAGERLLTFQDATSVGNSVRNEGCLECHRTQATGHHHGQIPAHADLSCGSCHVEHRGDRSPAIVSDSTCLACHRSLQVAGDKGKQPSAHVWSSVTSFDPGGHPDFALHRLNGAKLAKDDPLERIAPSGNASGGLRHPALELVAKDRPCTTAKPRGGEPRPKPVWGDRTELRFPHADHVFLEMTAGSTGQIQGVQKDGKYQSIAAEADSVQANCRHCHATAADGRYMRPIVYEQHCGGCHPLRADVSLALGVPVPPVTIPHRSPDVVRGFLVNHVTSLPQRSGKPEPQVVRPVPGVDSLPLPEFQDLDVQLTADIRRVEHTIFGKEAKAGCAYCHTVRPRSEADKAAGDWVIEPPGIPERWLPHSRFRHDSHLFLSCLDCHDGVAAAKGTGPRAAVTALSDCAADVNLPRIEQCFPCHAQSSSGRQVGLGKLPATGPVPTKCVDCHVYHTRK